MTNPNAPTPELASMRPSDQAETAASGERVMKYSAQRTHHRCGAPMPDVVYESASNPAQEMAQAGLGVPGQRVASDDPADRELLELAAKAAGVEGHFCAKKELDTERWGIVTFLGYGQAAFWNPLTDDGDAFQLAIKLELTVLAGMARTGEGRAFFEDADDSVAATRRAITRAAAYIARATKEQP